MAQPVRSAKHCAGFYPEKNSRRQQLQKMKQRVLSSRNARRLRRKKARLDSVAKTS
jgi:hypothetical protein